MKPSMYFASVAMTGLMAMAAPAAHATLLLSGSVNATNFCASDQNVGCGFGNVILDANPAVNRLGLDAVVINGVEVFGSLAIARYGSPQNILNSSSLQIINTNPFEVDIVVTVSATDYVPPSLIAFTSGSGTFQDVAGSTVDLRWWNDPLNRQGAETPGDTPGNLLDFFNFVSAFAPQSFAHNGGPFNVLDTALLHDTAVSGHVAGRRRVGQPWADDKQRHSGNLGAGVFPALRNGPASACLAVSQVPV